MEMIHKATDNISFHYLVDTFSFANRNQCKLFLVQLFKRERQPLEQLTYIFCSDDYLLDINKNFLQHNYYTDIITFELAEAGNPTVGEIYISIDRVKDNANQHRQSFKRELHRVMFHGALHLCGYGDKTSKEEMKMREMEDKYLDIYFA